MRIRVFAAALVPLALALTGTASAANRRGAYLGGTEKMQLTTPTLVEGAGGEATQVQASNSSSYVLRSDGKVFATGNGQQGQLGNGGEVNTATAVEVSFPPGTVIVYIGEARDEGFAIDSTGQGWAWGADAAGSLCIGKRSKRLVPVEVPGITSAVEVAGGENHVLWRLSNGTVQGCGENTSGQLGLGESVKTTTTAQPVPGLEHVIEISTGDRNSAARTEAGEVLAFGENTNGQIGVGSFSPAVFSATLVELPGPASEVSAGGDMVPNGHMLALVEGHVYGWGTDTAGQLGDGGKTNKNAPVATGLSFAKVAAGGVFSLGLSAEGKVFGWGSESYGEIGNGLTSGKALTPVQVGTGASEISATAQNSLDR
jgi:alpha-tubulin suppressor-like RCC1 family protein